MVSRIARHIFELYGAPDMLAAAEAGRSEANYTADLCDHPLETMLGINREFTEKGIKERIRVISKQSETMHAKIWAIVDDDEEKK